MGMAFVFRRHDAVELGLNLERRLAGRHAGPIADAKDVSIDGNGRLTEGDVEHHIGRLAADAGQRLQRLARARHLAAMILHDLLG